MKIGVIIAAGGKGMRMGGNISKQFMKIKDKEILALTIEKFENIGEVSQIVVVTSKEYFDFTLELKNKYHWSKVVIVEGGRERYHSVYNGLNSLDNDTDIVLIHDGVRPFVKESHVKAVIECAVRTRACILAVPVKDTIKICEDGTVKNTPARDMLWAVQTPQGFGYQELLKAFQTLDLNTCLTDDAMIMEQAGYKVHIVQGDYTNIKITTEEDMVVAAAIIDGEEKKRNENS